MQYFAKMRMREEKHSLTKRTFTKEMGKVVLQVDKADFD